MKPDLVCTSTEKDVRSGRLLRRARRVGLVMVMVYVTGGVVLYFVQDWLIFPGSWMQGRQSAQVQPMSNEKLVQFETAHGQRIVALHAGALDASGAPRRDAANCPTVLYFYGNGESISRSLEQIRDFARQGFNVLTPDFVGYGLSSGHASEQGIYDTADAAYSYLTQTRGVRADQLVIAGRSLGAAAAVYEASTRPAAGLATFSAFTTIREVAQHLVKVYPVKWLMRPNCDNLAKIPLVKCPIFIAHGAVDRMIPVEHSLRLAQAAKSCTRVVVPKADHNDIFAVGGANLVQQFGDFVRQATVRQ